MLMSLSEVEERAQNRFDGDSWKKMESGSLATSFFYFSPTFISPFLVLLASLFVDASLSLWEEWSQRKRGLQSVKQVCC